MQGSRYFNACCVFVNLLKQSLCICKCRTKKALCTWIVTQDCCNMFEKNDGNVFTAPTHWFQVCSHIEFQVLVGLKSSLILSHWLVTLKTIYYDKRGKSSAINLHLLKRLGWWNRIQNAPSFSETTFCLYLLSRCSYNESAFTLNISADLPPACSALLIRLRSTPPGRRSLAWAAACLAFARQVWPQGLKGHAKCNMGSGQQCWAEIGAAGAGELSTGAKGRKERIREVGDWRRGRKEGGKLTKKEKGT